MTTTPTTAQRCWVFGNQKGGVGKTTVVTSAAATLGELGRSVLVLDLDGQRNASAHLGVAPVDAADDGRRSIFDVLAADMEGVLSGAVEETAFPNVQAVPGALDMYRMESEAWPGVEQRLRQAMTDDPGLDRFDYILIDTPPSVGRVLTNALVAADNVVVVTTTEKYSATGTQTFIDTIHAVMRKTHFNPSLRLRGLLVNAFDPRAGAHASWLIELRRAYEGLVCETVIPVRAGFGTAATLGVPVSAVASESGRQAAAITRALVEELFGREA